MPDNRSQTTWISLAERPPPATVTRPPLLLRFRTRLGDIEMGYYTGAKLRILGHHVGRQLPLTLDEVEAWAAVDPDQLERIENSPELAEKGYRPE